MIGVQMEDVAVTSHVELPQQAWTSKWRDFRRNGGESDAAYDLIWLDIVVEELELFFSHSPLRPS